MIRKRSIAVVVGRFQVPEPHPGHRHLLDTASGEHDELLIILGSSSTPSPRNPLPFEIRKEMLLGYYPTATVLEIVDLHDDEKWSHQLDAIIAGHCAENDAVLHHSRDSFAQHYRGRYPTKEVPELPGHSGTDMREMVPSHKTADYRRGFIKGISTAFSQSTTSRGEHS